MNPEPLWRLTHTPQCPHNAFKIADSVPACVCTPEKRIPLLQHMIAGCPLDPAVREAMLREIEKCNGK